MDPRGNYSQSITTTSISGVENTVTTTTQQKGGFSFTAMFGKVLQNRWDVSVGLLHGDGAASLGLNLGPLDNTELFQIKSDLYFRAKTVNGSWTAEGDGRVYAIYQPFSIFYATAGVEGFRQVNGQFSYFYGAGLRFEDEDINLYCPCCNFPDFVLLSIG